MLLAALRLFAVLMRYENARAWLIQSAVRMDAPIAQASITTGCCTNVTVGTKALQAAALATNAFRVHFEQVPNTGKTIVVRLLILPPFALEVDDCQVEAARELEAVV